MHYKLYEIIIINIIILGGGGHKSNSFNDGGKNKLISISAVKRLVRKTPTTAARAGKGPKGIND